MIAVLGAMDGEISEFLGHLSERKETDWKCFRFFTGVLAGREVVIAKSGVGKVMAALLTQKLIDTFEPEAILFTGLAGGLTETTDIGDTVLGVDCLQHDLDATPFGFKRGEVPYSPYRILRSDPGLLAAAEGYVPEKGRVVRGRILTGDQFLTKSAFESHRYLVDELDGDAVEMEGASVALVAAVNDVAFLIVRTISDKADSNAHADFRKFLPIASLNSYGIVNHILRNYRPQNRA